MFSSLQSGGRTWERSQITSTLTNTQPAIPPLFRSSVSTGSSTTQHLAVLEQVWRRRRDRRGRVSEPPRRLVTTWDDSRVTFDLEQFHDIVKLTVTHEDLATEQDRADVAPGWPSVLALLKTLLETGRTMSQAPWKMHE